MIQQIIEGGRSVTLLAAPQIIHRIFPQAGPREIRAKASEKPWKIRGFLREWVLKTFVPLFLRARTREKALEKTTRGFLALSNFYHQIACPYLLSYACPKTAGHEDGAPLLGDPSLHFPSIICGRKRAFWGKAMQGASGQ